MNVLNTKFARQFKKQATKIKTLTGTRGKPCRFFHVWNEGFEVADVKHNECQDCKTRRLYGIGFFSNQSIKWVMHANTEK